MNPVNKILSRTIIAPYYRQNAGLFLFLFFLLFGTQPSLYHILLLHYSLIKSILNSGAFFILTLGIWSLYSFKVISFIYGCFKKENYNFLFLLNEVNKVIRYLQLLVMITILLAPLWLYGLIVTGVAIKEQLWPGAVKVLLSIIVIITAATFIVYSLLQKANGLQEVNGRKNIFSASLPVSFFSFCITFILQRQFLPLLITKLLSFASIYFFSRTDTIVFEARMLWLIYITALIGHSFIIYKLFHFIEKELNFYRNMPVKLSAILLFLLLIYCMLLLPEAWALLGMAINQHNWTDYGWMIAAGPSLLLLLHCLLYTNDMKTEEFLKLLFGVLIVFIFFSLSNSHWLMPLISLVFATAIFFMSYRNYKKDIEIEGVD